MYLSSPGGSRRGPAVTVFLPCSKCPDGPVYRCLASKACAAPSSLGSFGSPASARAPAGGAVVFLLLLRPAMCPSESLKGTPRRRRPRRFPSLGSPLIELAFGEAPPHDSRGAIGDDSERVIKRLLEKQRAFVLASETRAPAHFSETHWRQGQHQRSNPALRDASAADAVHNSHARDLRESAARSRNLRQAPRAAARRRRGRRGPGRGEPLLDCQG